ncbi:efflux RND transporter periplasmic adaptor subunit [Mariniblastus sp.]|nr:efflux RND transporter periplasmic adaptor subunit [Mariniblastus sp.]
METTTPPTSTSAPPEKLDLGKFLNATADIGVVADNFPELLSLLGKQLITHANCLAFFWVDLLNTQSPQMEIAATSLESCPDSVQQWACTTAIKAVTTGVAVAEESTSNQAQPVSMVAVPLQPTANHSLAAVFTGGNPKQFLPFMQLAAERVSHWQATQSLNGERQTSVDVAALQEISLAVADSKSTQQACRTLANQLKTHLNEMTAQTELTIFIGRSQLEKFPTLVGVSDSDSLPQNSTLVEAIESAMAECISRNAATSWPPEEKNFSLLCHKRLSNLVDNQNIYSFQLPDSTGRSQAVLTIKSAGSLASRVKNFLSTAQTHLGVAVSLADRNEQNRLQKVYNQLVKSFKEKKTKTICKVLAGILLLGMIPLPYQIKATSEVQPAEKMFLHAPFAVPLDESLVEPGDLVLKGAELARLDDRELKMELAEIQADLHRADKKRDGFVATHEPGEARLARHESEILEARLEMLERRAQQLIVRSPIDGVVIAGDWKNSAGMPLETGQSLFEIAPLEKLSIDIYIPEDDVRYAQVGQAVRIKFDAYPFETFSGELSRIHPAAEIQDSSNVFVATVLMDNPEGKLRPGMKGKAKCSSVWRPVWWNLLQKPAARCMRYIGW